MTTLSIPITPDLVEFIDQQIAEKKFSNKAELVRRALHEFAEHQAVMDVLEAEQEMDEGKGLRGDLRTLVDQFPD